MILTDIYNQKITILNKLKKEDSITGLDIWHKFVLEDAAWYTKAQKDVLGSQVVVASYHKILIPFHNTYVPYNTWKQIGNQDGFFTLSIGDFIVLGDVREEVTAQNIIKLMNEYEPNVCKIGHFEEAHKRNNIYVQLYIEGA